MYITGLAAWPKVGGCTFHPAVRTLTPRTFAEGVRLQAVTIGTGTDCIAILGGARGGASLY